MADGETLDRRQRRAGRVRLIIGLIVLIGAFYMVVDSMFTGGTYYLTVDEALVDRPDLEGRLIRVKGIVKKGSYQVQADPLDHRFALEHGGAVVQIDYHGAMPDIFSEGIEVVAEGKLDGPNRLKATEIVARCPSKYEADEMPEMMKSGGKPPSDHSS